MNYRNLKFSMMVPLSCNHSLQWGYWYKHPLSCTEPHSAQIDCKAWFTLTGMYIFVTRKLGMVQSLSKIKTTLH